MVRSRGVALALVVAVGVWLAACGGRAEAPPPEQPEEAAVEVPAPEEAAPGAPEEPAEPQEPAEPEEPAVVGDVILSGADLLWGDPTPEEAPYTWTVTVANDTTATLDITVVFEFLDERDAVIKTDRHTVRLAPAQRTTIERPGTMSYDQANRVVGFRTDYEWEPVGG